MLIGYGVVHSTISLYSLHRSSMPRSITQCCDAAVIETVGGWKLNDCPRFRTVMAFCNTCRYICEANSINKFKIFINLWDIITDLH